MSAETMDGVAPADIRPMPCVRAPGELVATSATLLNRDVHDARYRCLHLGVQLAANWVLGFTDQTPVLGNSLAQPSFADLATEYGRAVLVSAGARPLPRTGWTDAGRITGRGIESFLLWYAFADVPTPPVLIGTAQLRAILEGLGDVGFDAPGLHGPGISRLPFPELPGARYMVSADGRLVTR